MDITSGFYRLKSDAQSLYGPVPPLSKINGYLLKNLSSVGIAGFFQVIHNSCGLILKDRLVLDVKESVRFTDKFVFARIWELKTPLLSDKKSWVEFRVTWDEAVLPPGVLCIVSVERINDLKGYVLQIYFDAGGKCLEVAAYNQSRSGRHPFSELTTESGFFASQSNTIYPNPVYAASCSVRLYESGVFNWRLCLADTVQKDLDVALALTKYVTTSNQTEVPGG